MKPPLVVADLKASRAAAKRFCAKVETNDTQFELRHGVWIESCMEKRQDSGPPKIRIMEAAFGRVSFHVGDVVKKEAPQITDIEVLPKFRRQGYGEKLLLLVAEYLSTSNDPSIREAFKRGGLGISWDMSHGFWEQMSKKYGGSRVGRRRGWFQGDWGFPPAGFLKGVSLNEGQERR